MTKLVRTVYEYELDKSIEKELCKRGFFYTVGWKSLSPDGLKWTCRNPKTDIRESASAIKVKKEICDILNIESRKVLNVNFNMGVQVTGEDDYGNEYYGQYLKDIILRTEHRIEDIKISGD